MKYRMLTKEEMEVFDQDFKYFLIANGVKNEEWLEMNTSEHEKAIKLVALFSDSVLQIVYEKIKYLEHRTSDSCIVFYIGSEDIEMISLNRKDNSIDLSTPEQIHDALSNQVNKLSYFTSSKSISGERELEIHNMLQSGCVHSTQEFWEALKKVIS